MNEYEIFLDTESSMVITSHKMEMKSNGTLIFSNIKGQEKEVIAIFNPGTYARFLKIGNRKEDQE